MSLEEGDLLGRYRVEAFLAEGGMGRVYRAVDTVLGRRVALKVLAAPASHGTPAIPRLLREARAAAALSHPNICAVFDVGEADGLPFIAMELVQGTSLRLVLADPTVGVEPRLRWVHDLASALAAAHRLHIVHRDIKPDNVMIASDGRVRLLDFGVAKWEGDGGDELAAIGPDHVDPYRTREGEIVGTSGYMAPEQAVGGQVDARTDQFAWGVVAYETISGRHPFAADDYLGETRLLSDLVPEVPPGVAQVIARTLEIDRSLRFADMDEIVAVLAPVVAGMSSRPPAAPHIGGAATAAPTVAASAARAPSGTGAPALSPAEMPAPPTPPIDELAPTVRQPAPVWGELTRRRWWSWAVAALAVAALAVAGLWWRGRAPAPRGRVAAAPILTLAASHVRRITFGDSCEEFPTFTRDGRAVIYDGDDGAGNWVLYRVDLDEGATPRVIVPQDDPGWDRAASVAPDGERVVFLHVGKQRAGVMVADLAGKQPARVLAGAGMFPGWSSDGRAIWALADHTVALHDSTTGAILRTLPLPSGLDTRWILGLAEGPVVVQYTASPAANAYGLALIDLEGHVRWKLPDDLELGVAMAPGGRHVLASRQSIPGHADLVAVPLDGSSVVSLAAPGVAAHDGLAVSPDGKRLAWSTCRAEPVVFAIDSRGQLVPALAKENDDVLGLAAVPGARDLAVVSARTGKPRLWLMDPVGERAPRLIPLGDREPSELAFSSDGARFVVAIPRAGIGIASLAGGELRMLTDHPGDAAPSFRAGDAAVMFTRRGAGGIARVMVVPASGGAPTAVLEPGTFEAQESPAGGAIVSLPDDRGVPMVDDGRGRRPLCPELAIDSYRDLRISSDGARVLVVRNRQEVLEIDVAHGEVVRRIPGSSRAGFYSPAYGASGPLVIRVGWRGNIFVADAAFSTSEPDAAVH